MKIVTKKSLIEKISEEISNVKSLGKEIDYIELTEMELDELERDLGQVLRIPGGRGQRKLLGYKLEVKR